MLGTLSDAEMKEFGKFLEGTSYRKTGGVFGLYKYLKKYHPEYPLKKIEKEVVQKTIFKGKANAQRQLFDVMSKLSIVLETFLINKQMEINTTDRDFLLLEALKGRKLDKLFFQKIGAMEKKWEEDTQVGIEHLHDEYKLKKMYFLHPNTSLVHTNQLDQSDLVGFIDKYYIITKLYWEICIKMSNMQLSNDKIKKPQLFIEDIIHLSSQETVKKPIQLLGKVVDTMWQQKFEDYPLIKEYFFKNLDYFNESEQYDIINAMNHICYENFKKGRPNALKDFFELNHFAVENKIIIEDGFINAHTFESIVNIGCLAKEFVWTEQFINDYHQLIKEEEREDMLFLCQAKVLIYKKDFGGAIEKLAVIKFQNSFYGLQARAIQLKCYYELEEYDELFFNLIKSFSIFLDRDKFIGASLKKKTKRFLSYAKKLKLLKERKANVNQALLNELIADNEVVWQKWLLNKAEEIENFNSTKKNK